MSITHNTFMILKHLRAIVQTQGHVLENRPSASMLHCRLNAPSPCAVAMSWMPRCEMERAANASSSVPISSITCASGACHEELGSKLSSMHLQDIAAVQQKASQITLHLRKAQPREKFEANQAAHAHQCFRHVVFNRFYHGPVLVLHHRHLCRQSVSYLANHACCTVCSQMCNAYEAQSRIATATLAGKQWLHETYNSAP